MLVQALNDAFKRYFAQANYHDTVLWFDPGQEYVALLDHLTDLSLWRYGDSLLQIRYQLIHRAPGERTVVYLPLPQSQAETLRPFFATSMVFRERLYHFLRRQGLDFPDDPKVTHELRALLPRLAARSVGKGRDFWEYNLANLERAHETLLGNFDDALLRFLAHPTHTLAGLRSEQLDGLFFAQLESAYGLAADAEDEPQDVARRLTAQLALVRAFTDASQPDDFPFSPQLPAPLHFERCQAFLNRWQRDNAYKAAYTRWAGAVEKRYNLAGWADDLPTPVGLGLGATFEDVEAALWKKTEAAIAGLESEADWLDWLVEYKDDLVARADKFWAQEGKAPGWGLLARAADLLAAIHSARQALDRLATPGALLRRYVESWWRIDHDFRLLREDIHDQPRSYDRLLERCTLSYKDILGRMNDRFSLLLREEGEWPLADLPPQDGLWAQAVAESRPGPRSRSARKRGTERRMAIMFIDALRYELGQALYAALEQDNAGDERRIQARLAAIPTVTPIGMAALLPGGDHRQVAYDDDWVVTIAKSPAGGGPCSNNLKDKDARRAWLEGNLDDVVFYNLDELVRTPADRISEASVYIVFDTTLDAVGETACTLAWDLFGKLLQGVKKGVHKLLGLGVSQVHVVTDHGFLLLEEVKDHEKVGVRDVPALAKKSRYLVGTHLGQTDQLRFPVPGGHGLEAWFPLGIGCFRTPGAYNYVHGGLSLQELVVPHLTVTQHVTGRPVGVHAELPRVIDSGQLQATLRPVPVSIFDQPRQVTLSLEKAEKALIPPLGAVVNPGESKTVDVFLPLGTDLAQGDQVRWLLRDAVTDEVLAEQEATSQLDLW